MYVATKKQFGCPRNQGLGLKCTRAHFFKVLVSLVKVLIFGLALQGLGLGLGLASQGLGLGLACQGLDNKPASALSQLNKYRISNLTRLYKEYFPQIPGCADFYLGSVQGE